MGKLLISGVKMYSAIESGEKISLNQLHHSCKNKLQQKMYCPACDHTIVDKATEIIKGYPNPIEKDTWITLTESEIKACKKDSNEVLKIIQFVGNDEIPEIYFSKANYLAPDKEGADTFFLLHQLLREMNKVALAKMVLREKDHFMAVKPCDGVFVAYDLHFPAEIRGTAEISVPKGKGFDKDTITLAGKLVEKMSKPFDPSIIVDEYTQGLRSIIEAKAEGKIIEIEEVRQEKKSLSLNDALKESLGEAINF